MLFNPSLPLNSAGGCGDTQVRTSTVSTLSFEKCIVWGTKYTPLSLGALKLFLAHPPFPSHCSLFSLSLQGQCTGAKGISHPTRLIRQLSDWLSRLTVPTGHLVHRDSLLTLGIILCLDSILFRLMEEITKEDACLRNTQRRRQKSRSYC